MKAVDVMPLENYKIKVGFEDGVSGIIDLNSLIEKGIFKTLKNKQLFNAVYTDGSAIAWSDELEIDAANIYAKILHLEPTQMFIKTTFHAAD